MFSKVCVLLLAIGLSQAVPQMYMPDNGFMQFMMKSRSASQEHPARSLDCFDEYLPQLADVSAQYREDYSNCLILADKARDQIDDGTQGDRDRIDGEATNACDALTTCSKKPTSIEYFSCYSDAGSANTKTMYTISADSSALLAVVNEKYRLIDIDQYLCTNQSDRTYVENTAKVYSQLEACLLGVELTTESTAAPDTTASTADPTTESSTADDSSTASTADDSSTASTADDSSTASTADDSSTASTADDSSTASTADESTAASTADDSTTASEQSTEESTASPTSEVTDADKENLPEEDLSRIAQEQNNVKKALEELKKWLKRH